MEFLLKEAGERGLSLKQLSDELNIPIKNVKYLIYTSKFVKDTDPYLHGSYKRKIRCYSYNTEQNVTYIQKKHNIKVQERKVKEPEAPKVEKEWVVV